jgi:acyl-CoA thioester hydrolase
VIVREEPSTIQDYRYVLPITTRWHDNDAYGHVNNVVYYAFFDTVVNTWLIENAGLDVITSDVIGLVVETHCNYFKSVSFPEKVLAGVRIAKLGSSSVRYEVGIFNNENSSACAQGYFIHVYVDRKSNRPTPIPEVMRTAMLKLLVNAGK